MTLNKQFPEIKNIDSNTNQNSKVLLLKKKILEAPYEICIERARYYTQVFKETEGEHAGPGGPRHIPAIFRPHKALSERYGYFRCIIMDIQGNSIHSIHINDNGRHDYSSYNNQLPLRHDR